MHITIKPTDEFFVTEENVTVRAWTGTTDRGTPVIALVLGISPTDGAPDPQFEAELNRMPGPPVVRHIRFREMPTRESWSPEAAREGVPFHSQPRRVR